MKVTQNSETNRANFRRELAAAVKDGTIDGDEAHSLTDGAKRSIILAKNGLAETAYYRDELQLADRRGATYDGQGRDAVNFFLDHQAPSPPPLSESAFQTRAQFVQLQTDYTSGEGDQLLGVNQVTNEEGSGLVDVARAAVKAAPASEQKALKDFYVTEIKGLSDRGIDSDGNGSKQLQFFLDELRGRTVASAAAHPEYDPFETV